MHVSTLKIIVRVETFPLHQLTSCVQARALDKVAEDVAIFNRWPPSHIHHLRTYRSSSLHTGHLTMHDQAGGVFQCISSLQLDLDS